MSGLLNKIKEDAKKAGGNKGKLFFVRDGEKKRIRFLQDVDDGMEVVFHDSFERGINCACQELFGRTCPYCDEEGIRTRSQYVWSIWDYDTKEVKLFIYPVNNCSPLPQLMAAYELHGTITNRDYVISCSGKQQNKSFSVLPMDKAKFRNDRAKPLSQKTILSILDKAFPCDDSEDEEEKPVKKSSKGRSKPAEDTRWNEEDEKLPSSEELEELSARELYNLCKERDIDVPPKRKESFYIKELEEWREENELEDDDWADDDWADEEEEDAVDYSELSARELYDLCIERSIECVKKKPEKYYINLLEEDDKSSDDWADEEEEDWSKDEK